eukprot:TRINITY_DN62140_c0_g1_i1.p2 TRINITY_DN62140_c0_g1~~TRINITY_DN62140_c0_g1_i1.p2  ORF type:complete len:109 (-),score=21.94 TRINITY_DN62140_c0_g1_i1:156-482(-)
MPLVKLFSRVPLRAPAAKLHTALTKIWKVEATPQVLKVLNVPVHDESTIGEDVFVDIRAKAKPERTPEVVEKAIEETAALLAEHGYLANVRLELYEPSLQYGYVQGKL